VFSSEDGNEILAVLADGMGGHTGGGLAADVVVEIAREYWKKHVAKPMLPVELLNAICNEAHTLTKEMGDERGQEPHTTYVALHLDHHTANWAHVGDSREVGERHARRGIDDLEHRSEDRRAQWAHRDDMRSLDDILFN
jgi:serine/threonine protein phosphatase PrpC